MKAKLNKALEDKKSIVIEIGRGCLREVHNLPEGFTYTLIDYDNLEAEAQCDYCKKDFDEDDLQVTEDNHLACDECYTNEFLNKDE